MPKGYAQMPKGWTQLPKGWAQTAIGKAQLPKGKAQTAIGKAAYTSTLRVAGRVPTSNSSPWGTMVIWPYSANSCR